MSSFTVLSATKPSLVRISAMRDEVRNASKSEKPFRVTMRARQSVTTSDTPASDTDVLQVIYWIHLSQFIIYGTRQMPFLTAPRHSSVVETYGTSTRFGPGDQRRLVEHHVRGLQVGPLAKSSVSGTVDRIGLDGATLSWRATEGASREDQPTCVSSASSSSS